MSHDHITPINPQKIRIINKARIIAGLIAEMDAAEAIIVLKSDMLNDPKTITLSCDFRVPFESSVIRISGDSLPPGLYQASALFAGQRITFDLSLMDEEGHCQFPTSLTLLDLRRSKRRNFGPQVQIAEIFTDKGVTFATPIDISHNSIALVSSVADPPLKTGEVVQIKIRGGVSSRDVFGFKMIVQDVERTNSATRILLSLNESIMRSTELDERKVLRRPITDTSLLISPVDSHIGEQIMAIVRDVSMTGLSIEVEQTSKPYWLTPGLHVQIQNGQVHATVMWMKDHRIGLRLDALDESKTLSAWFEVLRQLTPEQSVHHSQVDELVNLFTESGLLKGARRKIFGTKPGRYLPPETVTNNPLLYHRIASVVDNGKLAGQISMVRLTDEFWCMQEGTHNGATGAMGYDDLLRTAIKTARDLSAASSIAPRFVGAIAHESVKSTKNFFDKFLCHSVNRKYDVFHLSLKSQKLEADASEPEVKLSNISQLTADARRALANSFESTVFEVFCGSSGAHPRLNAELSQLGPLHQARTLGLTSSGINWGIAFRLKSYYSLSSTGVINSVFLVVKNDTPARIIKSGLRSLIKSELSNGTDDVVIILDKPHTDSCDVTSSKHLNDELISLKPFSFYILDLFHGVGDFLD